MLQGQLLQSDLLLGVIPMSQVVLLLFVIPMGQVHGILRLLQNLRLLRC